MVLFTLSTFQINAQIKFKPKIKTPAIPQPNLGKIKPKNALNGLYYTQISNRANDQEIINQGHIMKLEEKSTTDAKSLWSFHKSSPNRYQIRNKVNQKFLRGLNHSLSAVHITEDNQYGTVWEIEKVTDQYYRFKSSDGFYLVYQFGRLSLERIDRSDEAAMFYFSETHHLIPQKQFQLSANYLLESFQLVMEDANIKLNTLGVRHRDSGDRISWLAEHNSEFYYADLSTTFNLGEIERGLRDKRYYFDHYYSEPVVVSMDKPDFIPNDTRIPRTDVFRFYTHYTFGETIIKGYCPPCIKRREDRGASDIQLESMDIAMELEAIPYDGEIAFKVNKVFVQMDSGQMGYHPAGNEASLIIAAIKEVVKRKIENKLKQVFSDRNMTNEQMDKIAQKLSRQLGNRCDDVTKIERVGSQVIIY